MTRDIINIIEQNVFVATLAADRQSGTCLKAKPIVFSAQSHVTAAMIPFPPSFPPEKLNDVNSGEGGTDYSVEQRTRDYKVFLRYSRKVG